MRSGPWTDADTQKLISLWPDGKGRVLSVAEISRRCGRTPNAVIGKAHRLELPRHPGQTRPSPLGKGIIKRGRKYCAVFCQYGTSTWLGTFSTLAEARAAYALAARTAA